MVGRESMTIGRADDDGESLEGRAASLCSNHHCKSFFAKNKNESNTVLPTGNLGKTHLYSHCANL